jgi:threonine/homoserine/homoserine lactone efflux protein
MDSQLVLFVAASLALIVTPGPDMIYVITRGIGQGRGAGLLSALGVSLGIIVHTTFAALGLSVVLRSSAIAFSVVKYVGACYLIYLGLKSIRSKGALLASVGHQQPAPQGTIFWQGVVSNVLNPKVALFFLAFLPQFVRPNGSAPAVQMVSLGLLFAAFGVIFLCGVGFFSGSIGHWLRQRPGIADKLKWVTGSILIGLGLRLTLPDRR